MAKKSFHFEIAIPLPGVEFNKMVNYGDLQISGVGYYWPNEEPENQYDFDIDQVHMNGGDITGLLKFLEGSPKEFPFIHDPCLAHVQKHFYEYTLNPVS